MSDETPEPPTPLPSSESPLENGNSAADQSLEVPSKYLDRIKIFDLTRDEICRLTKKDRRVQRILREKAVLLAKKLPTPGEIAQARARAFAARAELALMRSARPRRNIALKMVEAQLVQRLAYVAQLKERGIVGEIRRKLGVSPSPAGQGATSSG